MRILDQFDEALEFADSYSRMPILTKYMHIVPPSAWLERLGQEWESCDNISQHLNDLLISPLFLPKPGARVRLEMMTAEEQRFFDALPPQFSIWRGCYPVNRDGLCWSLSQDVAEEFPSLLRYRQAGKPLLIEALAKKSQVFAIKLGRGEVEAIIYRPQIIRTSRLKGAGE